MAPARRALPVAGSAEAAAVFHAGAAPAEAQVLARPDKVLTGLIAFGALVVAIAAAFGLNKPTTPTADSGAAGSSASPSGAPPLSSAVGSSGSASAAASPGSAAGDVAADLAATCSVYAQGFTACVVITPDNAAECTSTATSLSKGHSGVTTWNSRPNAASIESLSVSCDYSSPDGSYEVAVLDTGSGSLGQDVCSLFQGSTNWRSDNALWTLLQQALAALQHDKPLTAPARNWHGRGTGRPRRARHGRADYL
jgi:hypothetical protein